MFQAPVAIATIADIRYMEGVRVLVNSLFQNGFKGKIFVGHFGPLPLWAGQGTLQGGALEVRDFGCLHFVELPNDRHPATLKPWMLLKVLNFLESNTSALCYLDSDIILVKPWEELLLKVGSSVAVCEDLHQFPRDRAKLDSSWGMFVEQNGLGSYKPQGAFTNSGFVFVPLSQIHFVEAWEAITRLAFNSKSSFQVRQPDHHLGASAQDQDTMNVALGIIDVPFTVLDWKLMWSEDINDTLLLHGIGGLSSKPWTLRIKRVIKHRFVSGLADRRRLANLIQAYRRYFASPVAAQMGFLNRFRFWLMEFVLRS